MSLQRGEMSLQWGVRFAEQKKPRRGESTQRFCVDTPEGLQ